MPQSQVQTMIDPAIVERLSLYLQTCGIASELAKSSALQVLDACDEQAEGDDQKRLDLAMIYIEQWQQGLLDDVIQMHAPQSLPAKGLGQWALARYALQRTIRDEQLTVSPHPPTAAQCTAVTQQAYPATPPLKSVDMPRQSFGPLPGPIRLTFWKLLWRRLRQKCKSQSAQINAKKVPHE